MFSKFKRYFPIFYIVFLIISVFYVRYALNKKLVDVKTATKEEKKEPAKEIKVSLEIFNENKFVVSYPKIKMTNQDAINDLLDNLYGDHNFRYEKTEYTYGTEYDAILGVMAKEGYRWILFDGSLDITNDPSVPLKKDGAYKFVLTKK